MYHPLVRLWQSEGQLHSDCHSFRCCSNTLQKVSISKS